MKHVAMFSSGVGSAVAAWRVAQRYGTDDLTLLFADVNGEHHDNYRFLEEASEWIGVAPTIIANDGKTIWDIFRQERYLGNTRIDPCSKLLKRVPMRRWLDQNCAPAATVAYIGFDWTEEHRRHNAGRYWAPWTMDCPLMWEPMLDKADAMALLSDVGIEPPWLTRQGFPHANCGGGCVKAGIGQFKHLLKVAPETYAQWEREEAALRQSLGDVAILRDRRGGTTKPLSLRNLRLRVEAEPTLFAGEDWGGCGCLTPTEGEP